jgi:hyperosmotically inducible periplasmic protein
MFARFIAAAAVVLSMSAPAFAADQGNLQVFREVSQQVLRYPHFTVFDNIQAQVNEGVVTLTGKVTMPYKANDIEKRVTKLKGVNQVVNRIEVLPVSQFDDELRMRIARAIYGSSNFWAYGSMVNPPIHIIVDHGHVTLEGVVNSNVDRAVARSLASGFASFSVTNNLKTDAEMKAELEKI